MRKNQQMVKLFVVLLFGTAFIFSFSHFGAKAFGDNTSTAGTFLTETTIGGLDVTGKTEEEAISLVEERYVQWAKDTSFTFEYQEKTVPIDMGQFHLDSKQTVDSIKNGEQNSACILIDKGKVEEQLQILFPQLKSRDFDFVKLTTSLNQTAQKFENGTFNFDLLNNFLAADHLTKQEALAVAAINIKEVPYELMDFVNANPSIEVPANSTFSLLEYVKQKKVKMDSQSLSILATGIYQVVLPTNFNVIEKNLSKSLPNYAGIGFEAKVNSETNTDLVFANPNKSTFTIGLQLENNQLKVSLKGKKFLYEYKIIKKDVEKLKPKTIIQYSPLIPSGKTSLQSEGQDGEIVKVYRDIFDEGQLVKSEMISEDYYPPVYRVEVHSLEAGATPAATTGQTVPSSDSNVTQGQSPENDPIQSQSQPNVNNSDLWGKSNEQPK